MYSTKSNVIESAFSSKHLVQILRKLAHYYYEL